MPNIYMFSGPCGCGKSTLTDAFARHLIQIGQKMQVYVIHGDDFHSGFVENEERIDAGHPDFMYWEDILRFNWECIIEVAHRALIRGLDVLIDYVVEDELPLLIELAQKHQARLFYVVLTAQKDELKRRLIKRGSEDLIDRSMFLKSKLENMPQNQGHIYDVSEKTIEQEVRELNIREYEVSM